MEKCSICLTKCMSTISLQNSDKNNVKWLTKLQDIIPELEWLEEYLICEYCTKQLDKAWEFKKLVLELEEDRKHEVIENKVYIDDESMRDTCTTEYFCRDKKEINCITCSKTFTTKTQLYQHKLQVHGDDVFQAAEKSQNVFTCYNCNVGFNTKDDLICHIENEYKALYCYDTKLESPLDAEQQDFSKDCTVSEDELNGSIQSNYKLYCTGCTQFYSSKETFQSHLESCLNCTDGDDSTDTKFSVHNFASRNIKKNPNLEPQVKKRRGRKPLRKFTCELCNEEFSYVKLVIEHCKSVHAMGIKMIKPYSCEQCDMRFISSANLDQHRNYHSKNRSQICSLCGKGFMTKSDLTVHEYTHYNRRNYKCTICDKAFNTNKNLRTHNLVVHTDRSLWKYACAICEKRFALKTNYDQHLRRHTGEKEHSCHICKKSFISKSELQRHVNMHSNIRGFKCTNCDKEYKERRTYLIHLTKKHGIGNAKVTVREKKFVCHICPSQFFDKQKLMRHICSHSGLKPFPCYACDKKFTDKSYLKHHLKTAHKIVEGCTEEI